jgi:hypothetical protein
MVAAAVIGAIRIIIIVAKAIEGIVIHIMTIRTTLVDMDRTAVLRNDITAAMVHRFLAMEGTVGDTTVRNRNILFR